MQTGYVTSRDGARPHLAVNRLAYCGAGSGRIAGDRTDLTPEIAADLCRRCRRRVEVLATAELHEAQRRRGVSAKIRASVLNRILDALELPGTRAAVADLAVTLRAAARARIAERRAVRPLSGFGAMAAGMRAAAERERVELASGQLVLI